MDLINGLDGIQMINARIHANLIQHSDASLLCLLLERANLRRHIACGDHIRLASNSRSNYAGVVGEWHKGYNHIVVRNTAVELWGGNIERDGIGASTSCCHLLGGRERTAGC